MTEEETPHEGGSLWVLIFPFAAVLLLFSLMVLPGWFADMNYNKWSDMQGRTEVPFTGEIKIVTQNPHTFTKIARLTYNTTTDTEIRILEPTDRGAMIPISGKEVMNQTFGVENLSYYWTSNPCVPTHVYIIHGDTYEHSYLKQECLCG